MAYVYDGLCVRAACALCVTIFSTGGKFRFQILRSYKPPTFMPSWVKVEVRMAPGMLTGTLLIGFD